MWAAVTIPSTNPSAVNDGRDWVQIGIRYGNDMGKSHRVVAGYPTWADAAWPHVVWTLMPPTGITAPVYSFIESGDCPSNGLKYITTYEECGRAGETLGMASVNAAWYANRGFPGGNRQKYCGTFADKTWLHFNSQTSGAIGGYRIIQKAGMHSWGGADKIWQVCKS